MISSHLKTACYLHMREDHHCYGYLINGTFCSESEMGWDFIGVYLINRTLHGHSEIHNFSSCLEKYFTPREILYLHVAMYM